MSKNEEHLTPDEAKLLALYHIMDDEGKAWMIGVLKAELKEAKNEAAQEARRKRLTLVVSKP